MSAESGVLGAAIFKFGIVKVVSLGSALLGAGMMAMFRPPASKAEVFKQGAVALGCSMLFGATAVVYLDSLFDWINLATATQEDVISFNATVHGLLGAFAWGLMGGAAELRDRLKKDPTKTIKEIKDDVLS